MKVEEGTVRVNNLFSAGARKNQLLTAVQTARVLGEQEQEDDDDGRKARPLAR